MYHSTVADSSATTITATKTTREKEEEDAVKNAFALFPLLE